MPPSVETRAGVSGRELERKYRVGWRTVQAALNLTWPAERKKYPARGSKLDPYKPIIDEILRPDLDAPKKQRHTIKRLYARLIDEHALTDIAYQTLRDYVADRKPQIRAESGRGPSQVFIRQTHRPGEETEVDFGDVTIRLRGELVQVYLFAFRMSFSGKPFIVASCPAVRKPSSKATCTPSPCSVGCRSAKSDTTTCVPRSHG
ncbi:hypothetical protein [Nocardia amamiensis]|uniref:hypothetical protein n=1 Tax=Nocardia amamiensis TaxID=404578 RepID=UPI00340E5DFE